MKHRNLLQIWFVLVASVITLMAAIQASQGQNIDRLLIVLTTFLGLAAVLWPKK
jgi:hypothetical protein